MKKILITGTTGLVGHRLYSYLSEYTDREISGTSRSTGECVDYIADLTDQNSVHKLQDQCDPDVVIHAAAMSKTDTCENQKEQCYAANVISTKNLAEAFSGSKFIYFSTYAVYNTREGNCDESCTTDPANYYIQTKIESEQYVSTLSDDIILRPSVMFGYTPFDRETKNYFMYLLDNIKNKKITRSPCDQFFNPVYVDVVARIINLAIEQDIRGTYNIGSNENISKYDFNRMIIERFGLDERYLEGIESTLLAVDRPNNGTISASRIQDVLNYQIPPIKDMIDALYADVLRQGAI